MKITLKEVVKKNNALREISEKHLPVKISYAVSKNLMRLQEECELVEKSRIKLLESYAKKDNAGNPIIENGQYQLGENQTVFGKEFEKYLDSEIEVEIYQIPISELEKLDESRYDALTPAELAGLEFVFATKNPQF